jgi:hypothetical protein
MTNQSYFISKCLATCFTLQSRVADSQARLQAYYSISSDCKNQTKSNHLLNFCNSVEIVYNKAKIKEPVKDNNTHILHEKYTIPRAKITYGFLAQLMQDLKYEWFEYQFLRSQFYAAMTEYYYLMDVEEALEKDDPLIINNYRRFKSSGFIFKYFPDLGKLNRIHILQKIS